MLVGVVALLPAAAQAQAIEAWVQRYNGPGNGNDAAKAIVVDASGNVVVTGNTRGSDGYDDYATIEYSSAGMPLWTNLYSGPEHASDTARAVAADSDGNVYVTGSSSGSTGSAVTIKYSSAGVPLWTNRYNAPGYPLNSGQAIAGDASGNMFVAGSASQPGPNGDYLTIKYSNAGVVLWAKTYNGPANGDDRASALALDASGNVIVTGASIGTSGAVFFEDYATIKYSSAGVPLWTKRYNGQDNNLDQATAVAVDANGDVCVTGWSNGTGSGVDYATVKYSSAGVPLWTNRYNGPGNYFDHSMALAVDARGDVYVTGDSVASFGSRDYATIKYSSAGVALWTNWYNGPANMADDAAALAVDANGNVFVTGSSYGGSSSSGGTDTDWATVAYSSAGVPLWTNRFNGPNNGRDLPSDLALDANGDVYVTGSLATTNNSMYNDFVTVKYVTLPFITRQPLSSTNAIGTTASFTVELAGSAPFSYQWRREGTNLVDGGNLCGITTTNLQIANVHLTDAAGYSVVVTNAYGSVTSTVAQLTVTTPPNPGRFTNFSYSPVMGFSFIFRDATIGLPVRIQRSSSLAAGSWSNWQSFTYTEPIYLLDMSATSKERRFYRAVSP